MKEHFTKMLDSLGSMKFGARFGFLLLIMFITWVIGYKIPADPMVLSIYRAFGVIGILFAILTPAVRLIITGNSVSYSIKRYAYVFLCGLSAYYFILSLIGNYGFEVKHFIVTRPDEATVVAVSSVLGATLFWLTIFLSRSDYQKSYNEVSQVGHISRLLPLNRKDRELIAAHEAGHVLAYAALSHLPEKIELVVKEIDNDGILGYVSSPFRNQQCEDKTFAEWYMLMLLAGQYGETILLGNNTLGSSNDHSRWLSLATTYLSNHFHGIFYVAPNNKLEHELNVSKLEALKAEQLKTIKELFASNQHVFTVIANDALERGRISRDELAQHLDQVILPDGFPKPLMDQCEEKVKL